MRKLIEQRFRHVRRPRIQKLDRQARRAELEVEEANREGVGVGEADESEATEARECEGEVGPLFFSPDSLPRLPFLATGAM